MNKFYCCLFFLISFTALVSAQERISIHEFDRKQHTRQNIQKSLFEQDGKGIIPLVKTEKYLSSAVFGYLPDWEYTSAKSYLKYNLLTHIAAFDFAVDTNGVIYNPSYWPWTDVINGAHSAGTKIIMCVTNFTASQIHSILSSQEHKQAFYANVINKIQQYSLDGVNIDFEGTTTADRGSVLNTFMAELTAYVHSNLPGKEVSFAGPAVNWGGWDLLGLANACDYIFIMGYDFYGSWSTTTGPSAPLIGGGTYNVTNTVTSQYKAVIQSAPQKLILGVPYYGQKWKTKTDQANDAVVSYVGATTFTNDQPNSVTYGLKWNASTKTPWYCFKSDTLYSQIWFDNDSSLGLKYDLAKSYSLKGVGMWALGQDGSRQELWNLLQKKFYSAATSAAVNGQVNYLNYSTSVNTPLTGIKVLLKNSLSATDSTTTSSSGTFLFSGKPGGTYSITAACAKAWGGVNSTDALLLRQFVAGIKTLDSMQIKAADVNNSGTVNSTDALLIRQRTAGIVTSFPAGDWVFENRSFNILNSDATINFNGLCVGDLNGSYLPSLMKTKQTPVSIRNKIIAPSAEGEFELPVSINKTVKASAITLLLNYNAEGFRVTGIKSSLPNLEYTIGSQSIKIAWDNLTPALLNEDEPFIYLVMSKTNSQEKYFNLYIDKETEFADENGRIVENFSFNTPEIGMIKMTRFEISQNYPNPFNPTTNIRYSLPQKCNVKLTVCNSLGQIIKILTDETQSSGVYEVKFDGSNLASGIYFYKIDAQPAEGTEYFRQVNKFILLK